MPLAQTINSFIISRYDGILATNDSETIFVNDVQNQNVIQEIYEKIKPIGKNCFSPCGKYLPFVYQIIKRSEFEISKTIN